MSNKDVSIVFRASNRMSADLRQMKGDVGGLSKEVKEYQRLQQQAFSEKAKVKLDIRDAKASIKELEKSMKSGSKEAREAYLKQQEALESLTAEYKRLTMVQKEAAKAETELSHAMSRSSNAAVGTGGALSTLAKAGLGTLAADSIGGYLGQALTSSMGSSIGRAIENISGSAISGAMMGSIIPGIGTAVGAAVGAAAGGLRSLTDYNSQMDDLFRQEVQTLHSDTITEMENKVSSGSTYAAERETYRKNYASMTNDESGAKLYQDIMQYGDDTPYDTSVMLGKGMEMLSYGVEKDMVMDMMQMIGDIGMGDVNKFSGLSYAIAQSMNSGVLNGQDRRQMVGWGFDPLEYVAKNQGISTAEAMDMMSEGKITSEMLVDALRLATSEGERFHDAVNAMSDTYNGMQGQLESAQKNIEIAMGEGYNEKRKEGMAAEIEAYTGELGEKMKNAYAMVGAYEAEMENQYQQSIIKAMEEATALIEEKGLEGIEAEKVMWEAKTNAEIVYKNSEEYMKKLEAERSLVEQIQGALTESGEYVRFGKEMSDQFSMGFQDGLLANMKNDGFWSAVNSLFADNYKGTPGGFDGSHASGLRYVPYDGYLAQLHEGEQVLTRQQAESRGSQSVVIPKLADQIIVREDADIDRIAAAIIQNIAVASESYV